MTDHTVVWVEDDGGRAAAGYKGHTGDCVCRSIAIATQMPYQEVYNLLVEFGQKERKSKRRSRKSHPRTGVHRPTIHKVMKHLGWKWVPTMLVGQGCKVHLRANELPKGRLIISLSKHFTTVIDGVVHDTFDPSREGKRCVYGYFTKE
jgi:hypothetical protein